MTALFSERETLLLRAALSPDPQLACASWTAWAAQIALEVAPYPELRLLTPVYANLSKIASSFRLPNKVRGKARATFIHNNLLARESLPTIEALSKECSVLIAKGLGICVRFDAWSSRAMGDVDIHVPLPSLVRATEIIRRAGWRPKYGMTWDSLVHRTALRRSSWNLSKGESYLDLHWRPQPENMSCQLTKEMWETVVPHPCFGRTVNLQSAEYALATSLSHGFQYGTRGDRLQAIIDASMLLPACDIDNLQRLIIELDLLQPFATIVSSLEAAGAPLDTSQLRGLIDKMKDAQTNIDAPKGASPSGPPVMRAESKVLRHPALYRLWERTGRHPMIERFLIWKTGPFSKPIKGSHEIQEDFDLRDCEVIDRIGGPGWAWPDPDGTCFWSDRADVRLLIPLRRREDHMIALGLAKVSFNSPNPNVQVFANGHYIRTMNFMTDAMSFQYCFFISKRILCGNWVELSFRPKPYKGSGEIMPERHWLSRSLPVDRLRVYQADRAAQLLIQYTISQLHFRVLNEEEPELSKFKRIKTLIDTSPYKNNSGLPEGFNALVYVFSHDDLFEAEVDPYYHYLRHGWHERRRWR